MTLPIEEVLEGKYEILDKIGEGGIGSVYKVRHRLLDEVRVIKVLRPQVAAKEDHQERFLHEARMAIRLKHPNIAQLHDFSISEEGTAFIVMEFIDGIALDELIKASGPPSLDLSLEISQQSLQALSYLHSHELVHRDVSPDNIMLTTSFDGGAHVKLIDLGIAKNLAEESNLTQTGVFLGKVRYCSPEQFSGTQDAAQQLDHRSDIYSFGLLLYELLTGVYPFKGETFAELAGCHLFQPPISFEQTDPEGKVPEPLREVILKALEKHPEDRYASAQEFTEELAPFRNADQSVEEELNRTVERTTSAIPNLKNYTRPGSTQDRLNKQFGMGATSASKPLSKLREAKTAVTMMKRKADVPGAPPSGPKRWLWPAVAGVAGIAAVALAGMWLGSRGQAPEQPSDAEVIAETTGDAIEIEPTERFVPPEKHQGVRLEAVPPPPLEEPAPEPAPEETQPAVVREPPRAEPARPPGGRPPAQGQGAQPQPATTPPSQPAPLPGMPGGPPVARTTEVYETGVGVVPPVLMKLARPKYPGDKRPRNEVDVDVAVLVDEQGRVLSARVESGAGFRRRYRDAAVETAKASLFRPAMKNGVAGRMWTSLKIVFKPE